MKILSLTDVDDLRRLMELRNPLLTFESSMIHRTFRDVT